MNTELLKEIEDAAEKDCNKLLPMREFYQSNFGRALAEQQRAGFLKGFITGATLYASRGEKLREELALMDAREVAWGNRVKYFEEEVERLKGEAEKLAIEFAEWVYEKEYIYNEELNLWRWNGGSRYEEEITTSQLYHLFLKTVK